MFGLSTLKLLGLTAVGTVLIAGVAGWKGYSIGKHEGALAALNADNKQHLERSETDAEVNSLDRYGVCVDLLGRVPDCDEFKN